jgi:hypothetical protein
MVRGKMEMGVGQVVNHGKTMLLRFSCQSR